MKPSVMYSASQSDFPGVHKHFTTASLSSAVYSSPYVGFFLTLQQCVHQLMQYYERITKLTICQQEAKLSSITTGGHYNNHTNQEIFHYVN